MKIKYLTFEVSSRCNMDCGFCFSDWREYHHELSTGEAKKNIMLLKEKGMEAINFTGGEPLLRMDIAELIGFAKQAGLTTILTTNGILLEEKLPYIASSLDFVGLPLDSSCLDIHNNMRPTKAAEDHHHLVSDLVCLINEEYSGTGVKINTVVTRQNEESVAGIGDLIKGKAVSWKLSHFISGGYGSSRKDEFMITPKRYHEIVSGCRDAYPGLNIVSSAAHERDDCCMILSPEGRLLRPSKDGLLDLGRLDSVPDRKMMEGFNAPRNSYILKQTYPIPQRGG